MKKKIGAAVSLISAAILGFGMTGCSGDRKETQNSYVSLDINPSIELIVDKNDNVVSVRGTNEDGQVLLYGEVSGMIGKELSEVLDDITVGAIELGYLSEDNKAVHFSVSSSKGDKKEGKLEEVVHASITAAASDRGLSVTAEANANFGLMRRYQAFLEAHPEIKGVDVAHFRLALSVAETGRVSLEAAVQMNDKDLIGILSASLEKLEEYATAAYERAKLLAFAAYDKAAAAALDGIYANYYTLHAADHTDTAYYGIAYQMYASGAHGVGVLADTVNAAKTATATPLDEKCVAAVMNVLGMSGEEIDLLKDSEGNITIDSIEAYANKLFKNSKTSAALEQAKAELAAALNEAQSEIEAKLARISEDYAEEIAAITEAAEHFVAMAESLTALLPDSVKGFVAEMRDTSVQLAKTLKNGVTAEKLYAAESLLGGKAEKMLGLIKEDLSEEEREEVERIRSAAEETLKSARETLDNALKTAEEIARERLESLKQARMAG